MLGATDRADPGRRTGRDIVATVLAGLAIAALFAGNLAWWVRQDVYDTPTVTADTLRIAATPDTQAALAAVLDEKVIRPALDQAGAAMGPVLQTLIGSVADETSALVQTAVADAVASQTAQEITARLVATVNQQLVAGTGPITLTPTQLVAVLAPSLADNRVVSGLVDLAERSGCCTVVLADRDDLPFVWQHVSAIRVAGVALPIVAVVAGLAAVAVARRRRRVGIVLALGIVATGALTLIALAAGVHWGVEGIGDPAARSTVLVRQAARITFDVTVEDLRHQSWALVIAGGILTAGLLAVAVIRPRPAGSSA